MYVLINLYGVFVGSCNNFSEFKIIVKFELVKERKINTKKKLSFCFCYFSISFNSLKTYKTFIKFF